MKKSELVLLALCVLNLNALELFADPSPSAPPKSKPTLMQASSRDDRLEGADYVNMPITAFKFSEKGADGKERSISSRMDLMSTTSKRIPIGVSKKKGEDPKVVVVQEVTADYITNADIDQVVSACYGPTHPVPFERNMLAIMNDPTTPNDRKKSIQRSIDQYRERQKAEKKGIATALSEAIKYLKSYSIGGESSETEGHRRDRTDDNRSSLKWYTWHAGIGEKDDASLSEAFGEEINDYMPHWYPSNDFESEQYRQARPEVVAFKIDLDCLKKAWKSAYARASKNTLRCELDFKDGVKSGETFEPKSLKSLLFTGVTVKPGAWTEFTVNHPRIKSLWCDDRVKTFSDLSHFFDLSTSDMKIQDRYLPAHPTPAPTKAPKPGQDVGVEEGSGKNPACNQLMKVPAKSSQKCKPVLKKPTTLSVPASNNLLEKDNLKDANQKQSTDKKTDVQSGN